MSGWIAAAVCLAGWGVMVFLYIRARQLYAVELEIQRLKYEATDQAGREATEQWEAAVDRCRDMERTVDALKAENSNFNACLEKHGAKIQEQRNELRRLRTGVADLFGLQENPLRIRP